MSGRFYWLHCLISHSSKQQRDWKQANISLSLSYSLPEFYRHVLVFVPFTATGLALATVSLMLLYERWQKRRNQTLQVGNDCSCVIVSDYIDCNHHFLFQSQAQSIQSVDMRPCHWCSYHSCCLEAADDVTRTAEPRSDDAENRELLGSAK